MGELATKEFWLASLERAIRTFAQALLALLGTNVASITDVDWGQALGVAALAALASVLLSVGTGAATKTGPSFGPEKLKGES